MPGFSSYLTQYLKGLPSLTAALRVIVIKKKKNILEGM